MFGLNAFCFISFTFHPHTDIGQSKIATMRQSILLHIVILLIAINCVRAEYGKGKSKSKTYDKDRTIKVNGKDLTRKSIVFDKDTPDVFYCIPHKPTGEDKIIVRYYFHHKFLWSSLFFSFLNMFFFCKLI